VPVRCAGNANVRHDDASTDDTGLPQPVFAWPVTLGVHSPPVGAPQAHGVHARSSRMLRKKTRLTVHAPPGQATSPSCETQRLSEADGAVHKRTLVAVGSARCTSGPTGAQEPPEGPPTGRGSKDSALEHGPSDEGISAHDDESVNVPHVFPAQLGLPLVLIVKDDGHFRPLGLAHVQAPQTTSGA
jgi:hypothetical protein